MNKYYHAIHESTPVNVTIVPQPQLSWRESVVYYMDRIRYYIGQSAFLNSFVCILAWIFLIYVAIVFIAILIIMYNIACETTIVYLFGRDVYNKNFPVCTYTQYNSMNDCYTSTSTYCN
jgi:hypothetical protein